MRPELDHDEQQVVDEMMRPVLVLEQGAPRRWPS